MWGLDRAGQALGRRLTDSQWDTHCTSTSFPNNRCELPTNLLVLCDQGLRVTAQDVEEPTVEPGAFEGRLGLTDGDQPGGIHTKVGGRWMIRCQVLSLPRYTDTWSPWR